MVMSELPIILLVVILRKDANANSILRDSSRNLDEWRWIESKPSEWEPKVTMRDNDATIVFYTYSGYGQDGIYRNTDIYAPGQYKFKCGNKQIAVGPSSYIF